MSQQQKRPEQESTTENEALENTERWIRRVGYVVLFGTALAVFVPMVLGAIQGVQQDRVWDPFTGSPVMEELDCAEEAGHLIIMAGQNAEDDDKWGHRYNRWTVRCRDDHHELHDLLRLTRDRLRGTGAGLNGDGETNDALH